MGYIMLLIVFIAHLIPFLYMLIKNNNQFKFLKIFNKNDYLYLSLLSLFGGTIGTLAIVEALKWSEFNPFSLVILIQKSQPIFAVIFAYILLKEKINKKYVYVFIIAIISLYFMTFGLNNPFKIPVKSLIAFAFSFISAISFGMSTVFSRKIAIKYESITVSFYRFFFTTVITGILLLINPFKTLSDLSIVLNNKNIIILALFISVWGLIATKLYYKGIRHTKAIYATLCELAFPLTSISLDILINKSNLELFRIFFAIILFLTIIYINLDKVKEND